MVDGRHIKNRFRLCQRHCPISVKFGVGKQFFAEFRQWDSYRRSTEGISRFPNTVWPSAVGAFSIVSNTMA